MVLTVLVIVVVLGLVGGGAYYLLKGDSSTPSPYQDAQDQNVKKVTAEEIGLTLTPTANGKQVKMEITKLDGISSIEYDVSYDAEVVEEGETQTVSRGVSGAPLEVTSGESKLSRTLDLGTCSKNVCKYDKVVGEVTFSIRINYTDGTVGGVEEKISVK